MATLSIDGVDLCEINQDAARALQRLAKDGGLGVLVNGIEFEMTGPHHTEERRSGPFFEERSEQPVRVKIVIEFPNVGPWKPQDRRFL